MEIDKQIYHFNQVYEEVLTAQSLLRIYVDDNDLHIIINDLKLNTLEQLSKNPIDTLLRIRQNNFDLDQLENIVNFQEKLDKQKILYEDRAKIHKDYSEIMISNLKINIKFQAKYESYIRKYLKSISEE